MQALRRATPAVAANRGLQQQPHHLGPRRFAVRMLAFKDADALCTKQQEAVTTYLQAWRQPGTSRPELEAELSRAISASGILFRADGVVHVQDRKKSIADLASHILERHALYKHDLLDCFASARSAEDANAVVWLAVRFVLQNRAPLAGKDEASGRSSSGLLLEELRFDEDGKIKEALVCRQMTREETQVLTKDPTAVHPPDIEDEIVYAPRVQLSEADIQSMRKNLEAWTHCWDSGADLSKIEQVLHPDVKQLPQYGLSKRVAFEGHGEARSAVQGVLSEYDNKNRILGIGICTDHRAGFVHWAADVTPKGQHSKDESLVSPSSLDYVSFAADNRIHTIVSFTLRPYKNVRTDAPRMGVD